MVWTVMLVACGGLDEDYPPGPERFAEDLRAWLPSWYDDHGLEAQTTEGNTLPEAIGAVDPALVTEVTDPEEDPFAHDLEVYEVWRHPDVVWPGSDIVWHGAYERASGELVEVYDFN